MPAIRLASIWSRDALDSTTIDLRLSLFPWAKFRRRKAAVKMHTLRDLHGNIPTFIRVTRDGRNLFEYALRDKGKTHSSVNAIDGEIIAVHGEDPTAAFSFSNSDECRIREIHRSVGIFNHKLSYAQYIYQAERHELHYSSRQHLPKSFLGFGKLSQQIHRFEEWRPHCDQGFSQGLQAIDALFGVLIIGVQKSHQRPSVDENHLRLRRLLRTSEKRRPVSVEHPRIPPWTTPIKSAIAS